MFLTEKRKFNTYENLAWKLSPYWLSAWAIFCHFDFNKMFQYCLSISQSVKLQSALCCQSLITSQKSGEWCYRLHYLVLPEPPPQVLARIAQYRVDVSKVSSYLMYQKWASNIKFPFEIEGSDNSSWCFNHSQIFPTLSDKGKCDF